MHGANTHDTTKRKTVALVGGAHIHTPNFVRLLKERDDVVVRAIWDHDPDRAARIAQDLECDVVDLPHIWNDADVAGVVICSETDRHEALVTAAAASGKHMFVEKPLGITSRDSYAMANAIGRAGVHFTTGYFTRTLPIIQFLKQQLENGAFGTITRARGSNCHTGSLGGWFDGEYRWMADPKVAGCGAFGDLGTHLLDILMWLLGDVRQVVADIKDVTGRYPGCDESGEALLRFSSGVTGTLAGGWVDVANPVTLQISGTEGHAVIIRGELFFQSQHVDGADGKTPWTDLPEALPLPLHQFLDALDGGTTEHLVPPMEAAARVAVMEAAYASVASGSWVDVPTA